MSDNRSFRHRIRQENQQAPARRDRLPGHTAKGAKMKLAKLISRFRKSESGASMVEYGVALLVVSAIGIGTDERRRVLGVSCALSEAEVHWRAFLESLLKRGMRGVRFVVSDDHAGLRAARIALAGGDEV